MVGLALSWTLSARSAVAQAQPPTRIDVAPGIHVFMTPPYGDVGFDGNSVAIVSDDGVLVFDTNGTPAAARNVLAEIRKLTPKPVKYVVNSHWHWDHWYGTEIYREAFPEVRVIAQERTRDLMAGPALAFNRPGLDEQLPGYLEALAARIQETETQSPGSAELARMKSGLTMGRFFLEQKRAVHPILPDVTFADRLILRMGGREIQILNYGRAVTPGDAFLYLPGEKMVVSGDLLVNPVSFALGVYPSEWLSALERMDRLEASIWIPGHGEPLRDRQLLHDTMKVFRILLREGEAARKRGLGPDEAAAAAAPFLRELRVRLSKDDPKLNQQFDLYLVSWFLHRVYDELAGPLTDDIAPPPAGD